MNGCRKFQFQGFDYVVEIVTGQKICFGSTIPRNTAPIGKGLSSFQKRNVPEIFQTGPGMYSTENYTSALYPLTNKVRSKRGIAPLASKDKRFKDKIIRTPSPGRYEIDKKTETKESVAPFGVKSIYKRSETNTPGPATYDIRKVKKCRRTRFMDNFGRPSMIYAVETLCVPVPVDVCQKCNIICPGDYWHKDYIVFLCHLCWVEEKHKQEMYTRKELKEFKKIRNCSFMHNHEGTNAAVVILPPNKLKKKMRLENYLELYIDC
ncbi:hypothetical protein ABEB36_004479 [Hypothenemus hampei]|uniref:Uncharacterized protein n=1 Tax=Hypothenemus hampei TaxID=57062 RepID=A0ABD1F440_HYPHA